MNPYILPNKLMYDHDEFSNYISKNDDQLKEKSIKICKKYPSFSYLPMQAFQTSQCNLEDFKNHKIPISQFYKHIVTIWTDVFAMYCKYYVTDFTVCQISKNKKQYGPTYNDFITKNSNITIVPTFFMEEIEWNCFLDVIDQQPPFDMESASEEKEKIIPELEILQTKFKYNINIKYANHDLILNEIATSEVIQSSSPPYLAFRLNNLTKITKELTNTIDLVLRDNEMGFSGFSYKYIPILKDKPDFCLIELRFHK
jgi:hypothetical protein